MSLWTVRLIAAGGQTSDGAPIGPSTLESLLPRLRDVPVCAHWVAENFGHPVADSKISGVLDLEAIVGTVCDVMLRRGEIFGLMSIGERHLNRFLLDAERRGRLVETVGLSVRGRAVMLPPEYGESVLVFGKVISVDLVGAPLGGGHFVQSDAAEAAGAPWPALLKIAPTPRPARESSTTPPIRYADTAPRPRSAAIDTELSIIRPGEDYTPWN